MDKGMRRGKCRTNKHKKTSSKLILEAETGSL